MIARRPAALQRAFIGIVWLLAMQVANVYPVAAKALNGRRPSADTRTAQDQARAAREQAALAARLRAMKEELARSQTGRAEARDALKASESAISDANRELLRLSRERDEAQRQLTAALDDQARAQRGAQSERATLAALVRAQYLAGSRGPWETLLLGGDPNQIGRNLVYLDYLARAQQASIVRLEADSIQLAALADAQRERGAALAAVLEKQQAQRDMLDHQRLERAQMLRAMSAQIAAQRRGVDALERDAMRLNALVDRLTRLLAEEAARQREAARKREQAARLAEAQRRKRMPAHPPAHVEEPLSSAPSDELASPSAFQANESFASLRGRLRWPVRGDVIGKFGQPRENKAAWKGVFIRAASGAEVRAIAPGRVIFADWLRGFGNLLIVDHGNAYLSVYGNNETLLKSGGDPVQAGETIANVGATGGAEEPGLYFELRHRGIAFDPISWVR